MLDKKKKDRIIEKYKTHKNDTGSPEVQIAILTAEIKELTEHLKEHKKDYSSRRGLIKKVAQRRKLLQYLQRENEKSYEDITKKLKIRKRAQETMQEKEEVKIVVKNEEEEVE
ncbi:30S ribosomal protein S15 [Patescibacteria group bacterium]|nr:30S ribosomal protein S15 [Patescibacteria group bacterium]